MFMKKIIIIFNLKGELVEGTFVSHITPRRCLVEKDGITHDVKMARTVAHTKNLPEGYGYHLVLPDYITQDYFGHTSTDWPEEHGVVFDEEGCRTVQRNYWMWDEINIENSEEIN